MNAQRQIDEDHRLALELSRFPAASSTTINGASQGHISVSMDDDYADFVVNEFASGPRPASQSDYEMGLGQDFAAVPRADDWTLARALQALEFEIAAEIDDEYETVEERDFRVKEVRASGCRRQLCTFSAFCVLVYVAVFIACTQIEGLASAYENPMIGPPTYILVRFGAKEASLQVYKNQWWRLISAISLHGGVWHLLPNIFIQLRVGGYLNLVFGTPMWMAIYFISGIFGNMCSTIFSEDKVGVGASGSILGILSAWIVWIAFRWKKIPDRFKSQRNCQMMVVITAVVLTLATSFAPYVDWACHFGGAIQGLLWGLILLSKELDNIKNRYFVRFSALAISSGLIAYAAYYLAYYVHPSLELLDYFDANDDWGKHDDTTHY